MAMVSHLEMADRIVWCGQPQVLEEKGINEVNEKGIDEIRGTAEESKRVHSGLWI